MPKNYTEEELKNGHWATSNGVHIFIKDGEDISDAFARTTDRVKEESIKGTPLMQATALIRPKTISIDGYSKKATIKGALSDLAKAVEKYDKGEADTIRDMVKFNEIVQTHAEKHYPGAQYICEWEEVPSASRYVDENGKDSILSGKEGIEIETKAGKYYCHVRILR